MWLSNRPKDFCLLKTPESGDPDPAAGVYTRDILDRPIPLLPLLDVYKGYADWMNEQKLDGLFADWRPFSYDWRLDPRWTVDRGVQTEAAVVKLMEEIEKIATKSATGRVTLVAHSNGGLLAKALVARMDQLGLADLIDKLILVAVPQLGTPKGIGGAMHGREMGVPLVLPEIYVREGAETMPVAYNLQPSRTYFERVADPVVEFHPGSFRLPLLEQLMARYGSHISAYDPDPTTGRPGLRSFLRGDDDRRREPWAGSCIAVDAAREDGAPNVLRESPLRRAEEEMCRKLLEREWDLQRCTSLVKPHYDPKSRFTGICVVSCK